MRTEQLVAFLNAWRGTALTLPGRIEQLWAALYERDYIGLHDVTAIQHWLQRLADVGYQFPPIDPTKIWTPHPATSNTRRKRSARSVSRSSTRISPAVPVAAAAAAAAVPVAATVPVAAAVPAADAVPTCPNQAPCPVCPITCPEVLCPK